MVTFIIMCVVLAILGAIILGVLAALGIIASGIAVVLADIFVGLLPFIGLGVFVHWLFAKKKEEKK